MHLFPATSFSTPSFPPSVNGWRRLSIFLLSMTVLLLCASCDESGVDDDSDTIIDGQVDASMDVEDGNSNGDSGLNWPSDAEPCLITGESRTCCSDDGSSEIEAMCLPDDLTGVCPDGYSRGSCEQECGVFGRTCDEGEICKWYGEQATSCGRHPYYEVPSRCEEKPSGNLCEQTERPVCGCNGETFPSECDANAEGISVGARQNCEPPAGYFSCGQTFCLLNEEYCALDGGDVGDAATGNCLPIPQTCSTSADICGCLEAEVGCQPGLLETCENAGPVCWTEG